MTLPPRPRRRHCCDDFRRPRWTAERIAQLLSNLFIFLGTLTALGFAIYAVKDVTSEYLILTIFIVGGTLFGGGCLLALVNVSWMSRRPGVRVSAIQVICNIVLVLITSYLELLFWPYPAVAYSILFLAGVPMLILVNLPSCFVKKYPDMYADGDTICLDQDALDDATIIIEGDNHHIAVKEEDNKDETQMTLHMEDGIFDVPTIPAFNDENEHNSNDDGDVASTREKDRADTIILQQPEAADKTTQATSLQEYGSQSDANDISNEIEV